MPTLRVDGRPYQVPQDFADQPAEFQQQVIAGIRERYGHSPQQEQQQAAAGPGHGLVDAAMAGVANTGADVAQGVGALGRTLQDRLIGHGQIGDALVNGAEQAAHGARATAQGLYERPADVAASPTAELRAGHILGAAKSLAYSTAENGPEAAAIGATSMIPFAGPALATGLAGATAAGQAEHAHEGRAGLTGADMANAAGQALVGRFVPGVGIVSTAKRQLAGAVGSKIADDVNNGRSDAPTVNDLGDALLTGATTGAASRGVGKAASIGAKTASKVINAAADHRVATKGGFGDAVERINSTRKAQQEYADAHDAETQRIMQEDPEAGYSQAAEIATGNLKERDGMERPADLNTEDRRTAAELDFADNMRKAEALRQRFGKEGDAPLAKTLLDQGKSDAAYYVRKLRQAGPEYGGVDKDTAEKMMDVVKQTSKHNRAAIQDDEGKFIVTPEKEIEGLNIPEREKTTFLRHLDTLRMGAYNGLEGKSGSLSRLIGKIALGRTARFAATAIGGALGGTPGAIVGAVLTEGGKGAGEKVLNRIDKAMGNWGSPTMRAITARKARVAANLGYTPGSPLKAMQEAGGSAADRARTRIETLLAMRQAEQAAKAKASAPKPDYGTFRGDPFAKTQAWRFKGKPQVDPDAVGPTPTEVPTYNSDAPNQVDPRLTLARLRASRNGMDPTKVYMDADQKVRVRVPAGMSGPPVPEPEPAAATKAPRAARSGPDAVQAQEAPYSQIVRPEAYRNRVAQAQEDADIVANHHMFDPGQDQKWLDAVTRTRHIDDKNAIIEKWLDRMSSDKRSSMIGPVGRLGEYGSKNVRDHKTEGEWRTLLEALGDKQ